MANATPQQVADALEASLIADLVTSQGLIDAVYGYIKADFGEDVAFICVQILSTDVQKLMVDAWDQPYGFDIRLFVKRGDPSKSTGWTEEAADTKLKACQNAIIEWIKANMGTQALWRDLSQSTSAVVKTTKDVNATNYFSQSFNIEVIA